jgi:hypothetical protein
VKLASLFLLSLLPGLLHDEWPVGVIRTHGFHESLCLGDELRLIAGAVIGLSEVGGEVVEFDGGSGAVADGFPVAKTNGLKRWSLMEFPVKGIALGGGTAFE